MHHALAHWLNEIIESGAGGYFGNERLIRELASFMRVDVDPAWNVAALARALLGTAQRDEELFLDLVDGLLQKCGNQHNGRALRRVLHTAGSVWTVAEDYHSLVSVASDEAQATFDAATAAADARCERRGAVQKIPGSNSFAWIDPGVSRPRIQSLPPSRSNAA